MPVTEFFLTSPGHRGAVFLGETALNLQRFFAEEPARRQLETRGRIAAYNAMRAQRGTTTAIYGGIRLALFLQGLDMKANGGRPRDERQASIVQSLKLQEALLDRASLGAGEDAPEQRNRAAVALETVVAMRTAMYEKLARNPQAIDMNQGPHGVPLAEVALAVDSLQSRLAEEALY